jgi:hypothetical protein
MKKIQLELETFFRVVDQRKESESTADYQQRSYAAHGECLQHCNCNEEDQIKNNLKKPFCRNWSFII